MLADHDRGTKEAEVAWEDPRVSSVLVRLSQLETQVGTQLDRLVELQQQQVTFLFACLSVWLSALSCWLAGCPSVCVYVSLSVCSLCTVSAHCQQQLACTQRSGRPNGGTCQPPTHLPPTRHPLCPLSPPTLASPHTPCKLPLSWLLACNSTCLCPFPSFPSLSDHVRPDRVRPCLMVLWRGSELLLVYVDWGLHPRQVAWLRCHWSLPPEP